MTRTINYSIALSALLFLAFISTLSALGQSADPLGEVTLFDEEEFTIQAATKTELPVSKAPGSVTVISARQIRESSARSIPELLRLVGGVNVRWNPMVQTLDIRSFGQNPFTSRVLLLIDGVPYNSWNKGGFPQHPGFDFFMLQNIKRLEIVRGPGSALYGENAYWGVINIVTLSGEDLQGGKVELSGGDLLEQSLAAVYGRTFRWPPSGGTADKGSFLVSGRFQRGQLPVGFWFEDNDSEVEGSDIFLKGKIGGFEASYYRHEDDVDGFSNVLGFVPGSFRSAEKISQTVDIVALKSQHDLRSDLTLSTDVSYAQRDGSRCAGCHAAPQNEAFSGTVDHGYQLIGDVRLGLRMIESHDILIGIEARRVDTGDHTDQLLQPSETNSPVVFAYSKLAVYVQDQISLAQDRFRLTLGARFDDSNDLFDSELSPRIAAVYTASDAVVLRAGWSTAFRFPNFNELYQNSWFLSADSGFFAFPLTVFQPNPDLQPEEIRTFDLGGEFRLGPAIKLKIDLFRSEIKDFIVLAFNGARPTRVSSENHPGEASMLGGELELRWQAGRKFTGLINYSYQENDREDTRVDSSGKPFEFVYSPENKVNLAAYFGPFSGFRGTVEAQWRDEREGPSAWNFATGNTTTAILDSYTLLNARLSWDAPVRIGGSSEGLRFSVYGKNLLGEDIEETFLPIDMSLPGSTFYGSVEIRY